MVWVRIDDQFFDNPKIRRAGKDGRELYVSALCYANNALTDGFIHSDDVPFLAVRADVTDAEGTVAKLVNLKLWEPTENGYMIHDYTEYQPTAEEVRREKEQNAKRQATWRDAHRGEKGRYIEQTNVVSNGVTSSVTNDRPVPVPVPVPNKKEGSGSSNVAANTPVETAATLRDKWNGQVEAGTALAEYINNFGFANPRQTKDILGIQAEFGPEVAMKVVVWGARKGESDTGKLYTAARSMANGGTDKKPTPLTPTITNVDQLLAHKRDFTGSGQK